MGWAVRSGVETSGPVAASPPAAPGQAWLRASPRLATARAGSYDHGAAAPAGPQCGAATQDAGGGRLKIVVAPSSQPAEDAYVLVTAHVDDVESPSGYRFGVAEIDRSQSTCR